MHIPFFSFAAVHADIQEQLTGALDKVLRSGVFVLGDELSHFEKAFSDFCRVNYAAGVGSGFDALFLSLKALGLSNNDEIIVPAHTFVASWHAAQQVGLKLVPVDANLATFNLNAGLLESLVTSKTKAIMPVHMYGQTCEMDLVLDFCKKYNLYCIEDFAQAHGAKFNGMVAGSMGQVNATSFYPVKNLGALGDGGMVTSNDEQLINKIRSLRNYGSTEKYLFDEVGINSRLDEIQAAILNVKLLSLEKDNEQRREIAANYIAGLKGIGDIILPIEASGCHHVYHLFVIRTAYRDRLKEYLQTQGIETMIHYPVPPHLQRAYADLGYKKGDYPIAEKIADECLSLPCYPGLPLESQEYVVEKTREFFEKG